MKNINDKLNILSLVLCIVIIIVLLFGCRKINYFENFETSIPLTKFQQEILEGVKNGKIDSNMIEQYIKENKFTKEDLDKIITYIVNNMEKK